MFMMTAMSASFIPTGGLELTVGLGKWEVGRR